MWRSFFTDRKWSLWCYGGGSLILILIVFQTWLSVQFNTWYGSFYDLLQKPPETGGLEKFYERLRFFLYLAIPYVTTISFTNWFTRMWTFRWRESITFSYMPYWRAVDTKVEGASQRIQEDCRDFANIVENIGLDIVRAVMTLIAFLPILWTLSENVVAPYLENISGSLVWVALLVSIGGLTISWFVGIKLPGLEYNNQKAEAAFRKELVYGEDDRKNYAQAPTILQLFTGIKFNYHRLFLHYGYFDLWSILYRQIFVIVPFVVMGPGLFTGAYTLGIMMRAVNAFGEIKDAFNVFLYNWVQINRLRSIHKRLSEFEIAINFGNKLRKPRKSDVRA